MRGAYAVLSADARDPTACARLRTVAHNLTPPSAVWALHAATASTAVLVSRFAPPCVSGELGTVLVIGETYLRQTGARFGAAPWADKPPELQSRRMMSEVFGRYVAIFGSTVSRPLQVFRDPSGAREALTWGSKGLHVVASHLEAGLLAATRPNAGIDWAQVALYASDPLALGARCGLRAVKSVDAGCLTSLGGDGRLITRAIWRPCDWIKPSELTPAQAETAIRDAVDLSVAASLRTPALIEVSGGLDSSIVAYAASARSAAKAQFWINFFGSTPEADERAYAQEIERWIGAEIRYHPKTEFLFNPETLVAAMTGPRPSLNALDSQYDSDMAEQAATLGAEVVMTGQGGDGLFFQSRTTDIAVDVLMTPSLRRQAPELMMRMSHWTQRSIWSIWGAAVFGWLRPEPPAARRRRKRWSHPWLDLPARTPPAKRLQVENLLAAQVFYGACRRGEAADLVHPLLSQPLVELCLSLPTAVLTQARRDRALARAAFAGRLPESVLARRSKGDLTAYYGRAIAASLPALRAFLLEGALAREGLFDRGRMASRLTYDDLVWRGDYAGLLQLVATEAWVRRWSSVG